MAVVVTFSVSGMPVDKYETVLRRLEAAGAGMPVGLLHHVSYGDRETLQIIDVFDSRQTMERHGATLIPILEELGISARTEVHDAYKIIVRYPRSA